MPHPIATAWAQRLREFLPQWVPTQPALAAIAPHLDVLLHGSTTAGLDDPWSDLDLWALVPSDALARADARSTTRFFEFELDGKKGHLNLEDQAVVLSRIDACSMELLAELRQAIPLTNHPVGREFVIRAQQQMPEDVRRGWACYHYVEMRGEHRACDNPIERGHAAALLLANTRALEHALRCALVIDRQPYPYCKWLAHAAQATPTGAAVHQKVQEALDLLADGALRHPGPESQHPVSLKLRGIRRILIDAAIRAGLDEPWLHKWWLYMTQARDGICQVRWPQVCCELPRRG